ncbi:VOC family protein [uncultured Roseobacter sp.]|uniref:VOC family protein n=1 Tax=uncultured Roseobacter sp. TaxID=114847 RepID=UPI002607A3A6|nr:VOC family protein [uncultured Roseobacter sp.]
MQISSFSILVPDYEAGLAFFVDILGFDLVADIPQGRKRWVEVRAPGAALSLILARADGAQQEAMIGHQGGGRVWLFLETKDFARDHARLLAHGIVFEENPRTEPYGTVAVFRDPFGNRWDLIQKAS